MEAIQKDIQSLIQKSTWTTIPTTEAKKVYRWFSIEIQGAVLCKRRLANRGIRLVRDLRPCCTMVYHTTLAYFGFTGRMGH
jgi:hypothetical protein